MNKKLKFIISGGGTGGHIFPAIAIANELKKMHPDAEFLFVGAKGRMEMEKVPAAGYKIVGLWISGLQRKLTLSNLSFPFKVISSIIKARKIINEFKPDAVIGTGGYASGPTLRAAAAKGIPTLIQEQNSYPGITNKILSKRVNKICVAYDGLERFFPKNKIVFTGNPVRQDIKSIEEKKNEAIHYFGLNENQKTVLIIGGSLGARTINEAIGIGLNELTENNIQVIWQTGKGYIEIAKKQAEGNSSAKVYDFISRMDLAYSVADFIISRAGASSVSEIQIVGKPCVLIPSPNVAEDHQTKNAMALVKNNAALMVKDVNAKHELVKKMIELSNNNQLQQELKNNISKMAMPNAAEQIAKEIFNLIN
jgi:UDP-N-acetylglucosamine--N-acetylmuramyl-(pentapeptide) pyrophosphoryl-undecaprenol N-acetylglucosamine transferase